MYCLIGKRLQPKSTFLRFRHGHTGPSRLRLKRQDQIKEDIRSNDNPYMFHPRVRTFQPIKQALRNTKSIHIEGFPPVVLSAMDDLPFENILPQIKHSMVSSSSCEDDDKTEYGQRNKGLMMNVIKAVWSCADRYHKYIHNIVFQITSPHIN